MRSLQNPQLSVAIRSAGGGVLLQAREQDSQLQGPLSKYGQASVKGELSKQQQGLEWIHLERPLRCTLVGCACIALPYCLALLTLHCIDNTTALFSLLGVLVGNLSCASSIETTVISLRSKEENVGVAVRPNANFYRL